MKPCRAMCPPSGFAAGLLGALALAACGVGVGPPDATTLRAGMDRVSIRGPIRLELPDGWQTDEPIPGAQLRMASSASALRRYREDGRPEAGDRILNLGFLPEALFQEKELAHLGIQLDAPPARFVRSLLPMFRATDASTPLAVEDVTTLALEAGREAALMRFSRADRAGLLLVFRAGDGVFAFLSAIGPPDEGEALQAEARALASTLAFEGSQETLYATLYGDPLPASADRAR